MNGDTQPVVNISWEEANAFADWLSHQHDGKVTFRLPTEAEWEYAARAGTNTVYTYSFGNDATRLGDYAWYSSNSEMTTHPVGQKKPNPRGLYDMYGNVWEWCADWYGNYSGSPQDNPRGPQSGSSRVERGGSWNDAAVYARVANRDWYAPSSHGIYLGARLVRTE